MAAGHTSQAVCKVESMVPPHRLWACLEKKSGLANCYLAGQLPAQLCCRIGCQCPDVQAGVTWMSSRCRDLCVLLLSFKAGFGGT